MTQWQLGTLWDQSFPLSQVLASSKINVFTKLLLLLTLAVFDIWASKTACCNNCSISDNWRNQKLVVSKIRLSTLTEVNCQLLHMENNLTATECSGILHMHLHHKTFLNSTRELLKLRSPGQRDCHGYRDTLCLAKNDAHFSQITSSGRICCNIVDAGTGFDIMDARTGRGCAKFYTHAGQGSKDTYYARMLLKTSVHSSIMQQKSFPSRDYFCIETTCPPTPQQHVKRRYPGGRFTRTHHLVWAGTILACAVVVARAYNNNYTILVGLMR